MADLAQTETRDHTFDNAKIITPRLVNGQIVWDNPERGLRTQSYDASSMQALARISQIESVVYEPAAEKAAGYHEKAAGLRALDERVQQNKPDIGPAFAPAITLNS